MPKGVKLPNNFKKKSNKKVLIRMKHTDEMTTKRMSLSEHPFGTVKWYNFGHYVLCRGKEKSQRNWDWSLTSRQLLAYAS